MSTGDLDLDGCKRVGSAVPAWYIPPGRGRKREREREADDDDEDGKAGKEGVQAFVSVAPTVNHTLSWCTYRAVLDSMRERM